ncbi:MULTISPECIES: D-arabinono-1,4-lactone oxidase [unclassified Coleofasciculus]|uniref:D-arabinono-1,4-lactone oxidase n=1 Tax=unclassified Coleofasciculus TaxID=2692782 RepID=UPI0018811F4B|nr:MULTISPECIES: D-arabinono-1,4-lactone oxidase [unclassified Coleofasciculus]MBE9128547.1 FAD-binding protein [Coleofasciculus sp. LEGE 07081]MBE9151706.1 FAD-binding protein [Coleofasciculus sp. LEGE 07092]
MVLTNSQPETPITNFGGNISFVPKYFYKPQTEAQVLELLNQHATGNIRVIASLHAWSDVVESEDVIVDMSHFDKVAIAKSEAGDVQVTVGGGCVLQKLLDTIHSQTNFTLPTLGAVKEQTIAGAISTGTHGSGKPSLSHYMDELRVATYDPETGKAGIYEWKNGVELRAARCAVGCMGIILSVTFRCIPQYYVEETVCRYETLEEVLAQEPEFPLQQFMLVPYLWSYFVYQRRETLKKPITPVGRVNTQLYQTYQLIGVDILFHLTLKALLSSLGSSETVRWFYKKLLPSIIVQGKTVVNESENALTMKHQLFKHLEMEVFIPARNILKATKLVQHSTSLFAGTSETVPDDVASDLSRIGLLEMLMKHRGSYTHHYPLFFRRVLPDDTLISMTSSSTEPYYTISFFTYSEPRTQFYEFAKFLAHSLTQLYDARLHWGKYYPLTNREIEHLYPPLEEFRQICKKTDPNGVFRNDYTKRVLGFDPILTQKVSPAP